jgi:hypothetical protein
MKKKEIIKGVRHKMEVLPDNFNEQEWISPYVDKSFSELRSQIRIHLTTAYLGIYETLRIVRAIDLSDKWKEGGFKTLRAWLMKDFSWTPSKYYRFLKVPRRFNTEIIQQIGFEPLAYLLTRNIPPKTMPVLIERVVQECEIKGEPPTLREIKTAIQDVVIPVEKANSKASKLEYLELQLKEARKVIKEREEVIKERGVKIRQQAEKILELENTVVDQKLYIQELQQGKRSV